MENFHRTSDHFRIAVTNDFRRDASERPQILTVDVSATIVEC